MILLALPVAVVAMASSGIAQRAGALIAGAWFVLVPSALYNRWVTLALPAASGTFLVLTVAFLPFNSPAFVVDFWASAALFLLSLPRRTDPIA
jgi:hypothetical protein